LGSTVGPMPENLNDDSFIGTRYPSLIVIDDLMRDATNSKDVCELFVEGSHHINISVACILQNGLPSLVTPYDAFWWWVDHGFSTNQ
jgi:hypothetical protein